MTTANTFLRDDATFQPLTFNRATFGDASYNQAAGDQIIATTAVFTSPRTITLISAASVNAGQLVFIIDEANAVSSTDTLTIAVQTGQKLNGVVNGTFVVSVAGCSLCLESDGSANWQFAGQNNFQSAYVQNNAVLTVAGNQTLTGGFSETPFPLGSIGSGGSVTPNPVNNLKQTLANNSSPGGMTINAPTVVGSIELLIRNTASAGAITFSGFSKQFASDATDTTSGHEFKAFLYCDKNDQGTVRTSYLVKQVV